MFIKQGISVGNLLLDLANYRIVKQKSQKETRDAIIAEQGKKLVKLAEDIVDNGLNPFDLPMVIDAEDGNQNYVVVEGNRRLTAIHLMLDPELAKDTTIYSAFSKLNKNHADAIPKVLDCVISPNKESALVWINRKHANGLEGAGTEHWSSMAKARADAEQGIPRPDLDVVNFVLSHDDIDESVRHHLEGAKFNITTLERLVTTKELQEAAGFTLKNGKMVANVDLGWLKTVLSGLVTTIATGKHAGNKFTERDIDSQDKREKFIASLVDTYPKKSKAEGEWIVSGNLKPANGNKPKAKPTGVRGTLSTEDQPNLVPKKFRLNLPSGKVNDIFIELKTLDVVKYRHSVSVMFRVFVEMSIQHYIDLNNVQIQNDKLITRLAKVKEDVKNNNLMTDKQLKPIYDAISDRHSLLAPETLNAFAHSPWMNPDPVRLKLAWANIQPFIECLWSHKK